MRTFLLPLLLFVPLLSNAEAERAKVNTGGEHSYSIYPPFLLTGVTVAPDPLLIDLAPILKSAVELQFADSFCQNPSRTICDQYKKFKDEQEDKKFAVVRDEIYERALALVRKARGLEVMREVQNMISATMEFSMESSKVQPALPGGKEIQNPFSFFFGEAGRQELIHYLESIEGELKMELGDVLSQERLIGQYLRPALLKAIEEQPLRVEGRSERLKKAELALAEVSYRTPSEYLKSGGNPASLRAFCGPKLLSFNSFFFRVPKTGEENSPVIVVCPGIWIEALAAKRANRANREKPAFLKGQLLSSLSHELGHRVDYSRFPKYYEKFAECVQKNFFPQQDLEDFKEETFNEMTADYWSAETLAALVRMNKITRLDLVGILIHSSRPYCGSIPAARDPHPPGRFRIDLKGNNPRLRDALGCSRFAAPEGPMCALEGEVSRKLPAFLTPFEK